MNFGDLLKDKKKCQEIALNHWDSSKMPDGSTFSTTKVGEKWPVEFMPYWRKWMRERPQTPETHFSAWATVHDVPFWIEVVKHINNDVILGRGLAWAGMHGNLAAFAAAPNAAIDQYAVNTFAPPSSGHRMARLASEQAKIVHPDVVVFMRDRGNWDQADISRLARAYALGDVDGAGILRIDRLSRGLTGFEPAFYHGWYTKAMIQLNLNADEQAHLVGHILLHVDKYFSLDTQHHRSVLHPDVDVGLLKLALGSSQAWAWGSQFDTAKPELRDIYATLESVAKAMYAGKTWVPEAGSHPGMAMMVDLTPPRTTMELYRLGVQCARIELGNTATVDALALPSLE